MKVSFFSLSAALLAVGNQADVSGKSGLRRLNPPAQQFTPEFGPCEMLFDGTTFSAYTQNGKNPCALGLSCQLFNAYVFLPEPGIFEGTCQGLKVSEGCALQYSSHQWVANGDQFCGSGTACVPSQTLPLFPSEGQIVYGSCQYGALFAKCQLNYTNDGSYSYYTASSTGLGVMPAIPLCGFDLYCYATSTTSSGTYTGHCLASQQQGCYLIYKDSTQNFEYHNLPCPINQFCAPNLNLPTNPSNNQISAGQCQAVGQVNQPCERNFVLPPVHRRRRLDVPGANGTGTVYSFVDNTNQYPVCKTGLSCVLSSDTRQATNGQVFDGNCLVGVDYGGICQVQFSGNGTRVVSNDYTVNYAACLGGLVCLPENDDGLGDVADGSCQIADCNGQNNNNNIGNIPDTSIRVTICHRTCSETNPWIRMTIDSNAWNGSIYDVCGHQNDWVNGTCPGVNMSKWGPHDRDYILKWHGEKKLYNSSYWDIWEPSCPYARSARALDDSCCDWAAGECCGVDPFPPPPPPPPTRAPVAAPQCDVPAVSSETTSCSKDIKFMEKDGSSTIKENPIIITHQSNDYVTFKIKKEWDSNGTVYVQYFDTHARQYYCLEYCNNMTIQSHCLTTVPIAIIEIWVETGIATDNANISSCCHEREYYSVTEQFMEDASDVVNTTGKHYVEGTYEIWCKSKCTNNEG